MRSKVDVSVFTGTDIYIYPYKSLAFHYSNVIMGAMMSPNTSLAVVYLTVYSGADQRKHQSSASLALAGNSPATGELASSAENISI